MKNVGFLFIMLWMVGSLGAQEVQEVTVITKRIQKSFPYTAQSEVNLEGENAEVLVESWDKQEIDIQIELIAKHPSAEVARAALEQMRYIANRVSRKVYVRNYIEKKGDAPNQASLEARYIVRVPAECPVYLKNHFGKTDVRNLVNQVRIWSEFSSIGMENVSGKIDMQTRFGDITAERLDGDIAINARRSNVVLSEVSGNYDIDMQYGLLEIIAADGLINLDIDAKKTDVFLRNINPMRHQYALTSKYGAVTVPDELRLSFVENNDATKRIEFQPRQEYYANISIRVTFGNVVIEKKKDL